MELKITGLQGQAIFHMDNRWSHFMPLIDTKFFKILRKSDIMLSKIKNFLEFIEDNASHYPGNANEGDKLCREVYYIQMILKLTQKERRRWLKGLLHTWQIERRVVAMTVMMMNKPATKITSWKKEETLCNWKQNDQLPLTILYTCWGYWGIWQKTLTEQLTGYVSCTEDKGKKFSKCQKHYLLYLSYFDPGRNSTIAQLHIIRSSVLAYKSSGLVVRKNVSETVISERNVESPIASINMPSKKAVNTVGQGTPIDSAPPMEDVWWMWQDQPLHGSVQINGKEGTRSETTKEWKVCPCCQAGQRAHPLK